MSPSDAPRALVADSPNAVFRERERPLPADRFASVRERIADGLNWGVGAVVTDADANVLMVHEAGRWSIPGGGVEPGETLDDAARREVREESGVDVGVGDLRAVTEQTFVHDGDRVTFHFATFDGTPDSTSLATDPGLLDEDIQRVAWRSALPERTLDRDLIQRLRDGPD
jgi:8-oxo-dGTP pyrophosphatase MutT (NUDIX family)